MQCQKCNSMVDAGSAFCTNCGAKLVETEKSPVEQEIPAQPVQPKTNKLNNNIMTNKIIEEKGKKLLAKGKEILLKLLPYAKKLGVKKIGIGFAAIVVLIIIISLLSGGKSNLIGTYAKEGNGYETLTLEKNNAFTGNYNGMTVRGTYEISKGKIIFSMEAPNAMWGVETFSVDCKIVKNGFDCEGGEFRKVKSKEGKSLSIKKGSPAETVKKFFEAVEDDNLSKAKEYHTSYSRDTLRYPADFKETIFNPAKNWIDAHKGIEKFNLTKEEIYSNVATVCYTMVAKDGIEKKGCETLIKDDEGDWRYQI